VELDSIVLVRAKSVDLDCKILGVNCVELDYIVLCGGKLFGTGMYSFGRQKLWTWTV
jgi:hypothetical protein